MREQVWLVRSYVDLLRLDLFRMEIKTGPSLKSQIYCRKINILFTEYVQQTLKTDESWSDWEPQESRLVPSGPDRTGHEQDQVLRRPEQPEVGYQGPDSPGDKETEQDSN